MFTWIWVCDACWGDPHQDEKAIADVRSRRACELCGSGNGGKHFHPLDSVSEVRRLRAVVAGITGTGLPERVVDVIGRAVTALAATTGGDWEVGGRQYIRGSEEGTGVHEKRDAYYGGKLIAESVFDAGNLAWIVGSRRLVQDLVVELRRSYASTVHAQVTEFHKAFGQAIEPMPTIPDDSIVRLRAKLIAEECIEGLEAIFDSVPDIDRIKRSVNRLVEYGKIDVVLMELADALADIDYVVAGTRLAFGIDGDPIAAEVHRSNMAKLGPDGKPIVREDGKRLKPPGWTPPDIVGVLRKQGWQS
jgi:predicted HAD superfamily Cof-like phosphohydrolase